MYTRNFEIDPERFPYIVFESDDWGTCAQFPTAEIAAQNHDNGSTLESGADLETLFAILERHRGADGMPAVFTAFTLMGNPDFEAIRAGHFLQYHDISIADGFPAPWDGRGNIEAMLSGQRRGVWEPEYHGLLHHTSPKLWLERLRSAQEDGERARRLFDCFCYSQGVHLPEYQGFSLREQWLMIECGFQRFQRLFGRLPAAAVTSDAYPETVLLWAAGGARTVSLINCRVNSGETVVYPTKPWNFQDVYARIGDLSTQSGVVYLTRNVFFELDLSDRSHFGPTAEDILPVIHRNRDYYGEGSVISVHRSSFVLFDPVPVKQRLYELNKLLTILASDGCYFLSSGELGDLFRQGWSARRIGSQTLLRKWSECAFPLAGRYGRELPAGKSIRLTEQSIGNYLLEGEYLEQ